MCSELQGPRKRGCCRLQHLRSPRLDRDAWWKYPQCSRPVASTPPGFRSACFVLRSLVARTTPAVAPGSPSGSQRKPWHKAAMSLGGREAGHYVWVADHGADTGQEKSRGGLHESGMSLVACITLFCWLHGTCTVLYIICVQQ